MTMLELNKIYKGDCLELMRYIPDGSIDMILCDLPYGTTACKWDTIIPFVPLWEHYERIIKPNGAIVLTAGQPFTSALVMSNPKLFKYAWHWDKVNGIRNHLNAKKQPMRKVEDVCVFYGKQPTYNPQMREGGYVSRKTKPSQSDGFGKVSGVDVGRKKDELYPFDLLSIPSHDPNNSIHPTQKPVALFEYFIKTYTNEGETVLDNCSGSGTTAEACQNTGRNFICIEQDETHFLNSLKRVMPFNSFKPERPTTGIVVHGHFTVKPAVTVQWSGVDIATGETLFVSKPYEGGTNTIAEFLSIIHALAVTKEDKKFIYTDSFVARYWIQEGQCRYDKSVAQSPDLESAIQKAIRFLIANPDCYNRVQEWNFHEFGLNPANLWREPLVL